MTADTIHPIQSNTILTAAKNEHFVSNKDISPSLMERCLITKKFVYVYDASINGYGKIKFVTVDADVIVIAVVIYHLLLVSELWVEVETGGDRCWYPLHIYANLLGQKKAEPCCFGIHLPDATPSLCLPVKGKEHVGTYGNVFHKTLAHL